MSPDLRVDAYHGAPALAAAGLTLFGLSLPDLVYLLTAIYTTLMIVKLVYQTWIEPRRKRRR